MKKLSIWLSKSYFMQIAFFTLTTLLGLSGCGSSNSSVDITARYTDAIAQVMAPYNAPGVVAGVWSPGQAPIRIAMGVGNVETRQSMQFEDNFPLYSISKSFVVTALLQLVADGAISLEDPLSKHVAGIPNGDKITLLQLAAMESGIKNYLSAEAFRTIFLSDVQQAFTPRQLVDYAIPESPVFASGAQFDYSNTNTVLLGLVIEAVTQAPVEATLKTRIFDRLGLKHTIYLTSLNLPGPHPMPYLLDLQNKGAPTVVPFVNPTSLAGSGAIMATLDDLAIWGQALGSGSLLPSPLHAMRFSHSRPATDRTVGAQYGVGIASLRGWWGHSGSGYGFHTAVFFDRQSGTTIVVLVNASPINAPSYTNIAEDIFSTMVDVFNHKGLYTSLK